MKVTVTVVPRAHEERIEELSDGDLKIWVRSIPEKGAVNKDVQEILAAYFDEPKSSVTLVRGAKSRTKIFQIIKE